MRFRLLRHFLFAFVLLFAQQGATVHALSHLAERAPLHSEQDKHQPHSPACDKCVVYAEVGAGVQVTPLVFHHQDAAPLQWVIRAAGFVSPLPRYYASRAPPFPV